MLFKRAIGLAYIRACSIGLASMALVVGCGGGSVETKSDFAAIDTSAPVSDWEMVWSDEFDGNSIDTSKWTHEVNCDGGGNNEKQCYTDSPDNSYVSGGTLKIVALPAAEDAQQPYTSARLNTANKADFKYGRFEMRAKLPFGQGSWPAFWMLPTDFEYGGWPRSGEVDIMEAVNLKVVNDDGLAEANIHGTLHYGGPTEANGFASANSGKAYQFPENQNPADDFHTYAIEWQEGEIRWYVDGYLYATQRQSEVRFNSKGQRSGLRHQGWYAEYFDAASGELATHWDTAPFDKQFHLLLNLAVGGNWPENVNAGGIDQAAFANGQVYEVDFVRVYRCNADRITGKGCDTVRAGYNVEEDALVLGKAPIPFPPAPPGPVADLTIFDGADNPTWPLWLSDEGGPQPRLVNDGDEYGDVAEFEIGSEPAVAGFNSRTANDPQPPYNATSKVDAGTLEFDFKLVSPPANAAAAWKLKVESENAASAAEVDFVLDSTEAVYPTVGEWQHYSFSLSMLQNRGLDVSAIDIVMMFPEWNQGAGAVYRITNLIIGDGNAVTSPQLVIFDEEVNEQWAPWDCCGGSDPGIVGDDADHGNTVRFEVGGNPETVFGFSGREGNGDNGGVSFDASGILTNGVVQFDLKVLTSPSDTSAEWLFKIEAGASSAVELPLSASNEGLNPVEGEWATYTYNLSDLSNAGLDLSAIDVVMMFASWGKSAGASFLVDKVKIYDPSAPTGGSGGSSLSLDLFVDGENPDWPLWDCCAGSQPAVVTEDDVFGAVAEFRIETNPETVLGFMGRDNGSSFDATTLLADGVFQFDMKVSTMPTNPEADWLMKLEGGSSDNFVELALVSSTEGQEPTLGAWQTYTFPLNNLFSQGLDISAIDVVMIFPTWNQSLGAVYRVDNVRIYSPSGGDDNSDTGGDDNADTGSDDNADTGSDDNADTGGDDNPDTGGDDNSDTGSDDDNSGSNGGGNQVSNGGFDTDTTGWTLSDGTTIADDGGNVLFAPVAEAGDAWSVNASFVTSITQGDSYILTFRAKASVARTILAGIGLNENPWTSVTNTVALTDEWKSFTYALTATEFGGDNSRVLFDMGAEVGDVSIDDVMLKRATLGDELVGNTAFDSLDGWTLSDVISLISDDGSVLFAPVAAAGDSFSVNASYVLAISQDGIYQLSFRAKASVERSMIAGIGLNAAPWTAATQNAALTTEWQTYTYTLVAAGIDGENSRVLFDMGAAIGDVSLDDVSLKLVSEVPEMSAEPAALVANGTFDSTDGWTLSSSISLADDAGAILLATVSEAGDPWSVNASYATSLEQGALYQLSFRAKASVARTMISGIGLNENPFTSATASTALTSEWQAFDYLFTATGFGENSRVLFDMGAEVGDVSIDDVVLTKVTLGSELLGNGSFENTEGWTLSAGIEVMDDDGMVLKAPVAVVAESWTVNASYVLPIVQDTKYQLTFRAKASTARSIIAGIGLNQDPWTPATQIANLTTEWQTFTYLLRAAGINGDNSRVLFDMGAELGDVSIDDVSLKVVE